MSRLNNRHADVLVAHARLRGWDAKFERNIDGDQYFDFEKPGLKDSYFRAEWTRIADSAGRTGRMAALSVQFYEVKTAITLPAAIKLLTMRMDDAEDGEGEEPEEEDPGEEIPYDQV